VVGVTGRIHAEGQQDVMSSDLFRYEAGHLAAVSLHDMARHWREKPAKSELRRHSRFDDGDTLAELLKRPWFFPTIRATECY